MNQRIKYIFVFLVCLCSFNMQSKVMVTARLDSVNLLMGKLTTLSMEVVQDKGKPGGFPMFKDVNPAVGYVGVCGDSIELRSSYKTDTIDLGSGRIQINYRIPLQAFDSGTYRLPEFVYVSESDSARSNALTLNVVPVKVTADDPIAGFAKVAEPDSKFYDFVPNWLADFWWIIIVLILAIAVALWALRRYKKEGSVLPKKPEPTPYEVAISSLRRLKEKKLWEQGMEKEYFTDLTDILRVYLDKRFGINAMEMTTREIMDHLYRNSDIKDKRDYMRQILNVADFVKFAKVRPLPADNIVAYDNAVKFVEETKPVIQEKPDENALPSASGQSQEISQDPIRKGGEK